MDGMNGCMDVCLYEWSRLGLRLRVKVKPTFRFRV